MPARSSRRDWVYPQGLARERRTGDRFGLSRSADGTVFRVDLAYAIGPVQQANRWILSISSARASNATATPTPTSLPTSTQ